MTYFYAGERFKRTPQRDEGKNLGRSPIPQQSQSGPFSPGTVARQMARWWMAIATVRGGAEALLEEGSSYLPQEPLEDDDSYSLRLSRAVLGFTPWYKRLVLGLVGTVFRKPIAIDGATETLLDHLDDVTLTGQSLDLFASRWFESAVDCQYSGVLIDFPDTSEYQTRADEVAANVRPYWVLYPGDRISDFRYQQRGGDRSLSMVRLSQTVVEQGLSEFADEQVDQALVYDLNEGRCRYRIFRKNQEGIEYLHKEGLLSIAYIPFVLFSVGEIGEEPPMVELAYLNLKHYQLQADLDHSLHICHVPRQFIFGMSAEELGDLGSTSEAVCIPSTDARVEWSTPSITTYDALQGRIDKCEMQMASLALSAMQSQKNVGESADAKRLDRAQSDSILGRMAIAFQSSLNQVLEIHSDYVGEPPPEATIDRDFDVTQITADMVRALVDVVNAGRLTTMTFLHLLKQGEVGFPDSWTPEDEIAGLEKERELEVEARKVAIASFADDGGDGAYNDEQDNEQQREPLDSSADQ